jgi:hypothetical protein
MQPITFLAPARNASGTFYVALATPLMIGVLVESSSDKTIKPDFGTKVKFTEVYKYILGELAKQKQLFSKPPSQESLEFMSPVWGPIVDGTTVRWNQPIETTSLVGPCWADIQLLGLSISRSAIVPRFEAVFKKPLKVEAPVIDFDWPVQTASELEEVSDIPTSEGGVMTLRDPATIEREKQEAKSRVRAAFLAAESARESAESLAAKFIAEFDLSDTESAFTEWLSDHESDED